LLWSIDAIMRGAVICSVSSISSNGSISSMCRGPGFSLFGVVVADDDADDDDDGVLVSTASCCVSA